MSEWTLVPDERTVPPPSSQVEPGPWRLTDGTVMHGLYRKGVEHPPPQKNSIAGVAIWQGWCQWSWIGLETWFKNAWLSPWNEILSKGGDTDPFTWQRAPGWSASWVAEALLSGLKPYGSFDCSPEQATQWTQLADAAGLAYKLTPLNTDKPDTRPKVTITAAVTLPYREIFDLEALIACYRMVLPPQLAEPQAHALHQLRDRPISMHVLADEDHLRTYPRAVRDTTLGYDPSITTARVLSEARQPGQPDRSIGTLVRQDQAHTRHVDHVDGVDPVRDAYPRFTAMQSIACW